MRFGPWHRLHDAAAAAPPTSGVLQVRREHGLVDYPRGKSAMILYAPADDLQAACAALAAAHPRAPWLCRFNAETLTNRGEAAARLIADFAARFGGPPTLPGATLVDPELLWERSVARPQVDRVFVDAHLARWPALHGRPFAVLAGGLRSLNLQIDEIVARIAIETPSSLRREAALLRAMKDRVRVPRVIDASDEVLLLEYVAHAELPASALAGELVGATAAAIHSVQQTGCGQLGDDATIVEPFSSALAALHGWIEPALRGVAGRRLGPHAAAIAARWARDAAAMEAACATCVLVHGDFKPANIKWIPATQEVLVLDWEFAWAGPALCDVGQLLRWDPPPPFVAGFERGYLTGGGHLPDDWQRLAASFDLFNMVNFMDSPEERPRRSEDVLARIARTLAQ